jgi:Flp pilus assembly protein TadD
VLALAELNRDEEALVECDALLAVEPDNTDALNNRGNLLAAMGRHEEAIAAYDRVLALDPDYVSVIDNRGNALRALGRHDEALAAHDAALARKPNNADALNNRGAVLVDLQRPFEALQCFDRALALRPDDIDMINNRGIALLMLQRFEEVLENAGRALRVDPNNAIAYTQRGTALQLAERYDEATQSLEKAIALEPDHSDAQYNKALLHLRSGAFAEGWDLYEQRWTALKTLVPRAYKQPHWNGEHVKGTLLAWGEQGLGDHILYSSMVPDLLQRADSVTLEIEPRLVPMFARSFPSVHVVPMNPDLHAGHADAHTPLAGAGRYLRKDWQAFPRRENGYLKADTAMTKTLRERLASDGRRLIGLSWRSHNPEIGAAKTALLTDFAPLFRLPNCRFVDLQYGDTLAERETLERDTGVVVEHVDEIDNTNDIDALAALVSACDAVVTVSNTTAHLAGALGKPTFVFVPYGSARLWYWFAERDDSPWYPRVHVARQRQSQSWAQLIAPAVQDIARSIEAS